MSSYCHVTRHRLLAALDRALRPLVSLEARPRLGFAHELSELGEQRRRMRALALERVDSV
jgi:hypothetical protein